MRYCLKLNRNGEEVELSFKPANDDGPNHEFSVWANLGAEDAYFVGNVQASQLYWLVEQIGSWCPRDALGEVSHKPLT